MYKILIEKYDGRKYGQEFETLSELEAWRDKHIANDTWGKKARIIEKSEAHDPSLVIAEFEDENFDGETRILVSLKAEYEILPIEDLTEETAKRNRMSEVSKKASLYKKFKAFGEEVELYFTALINEREYTQEQKDSLQVNASVGVILGELKFGRIAKAKLLVDALVADDNLFFEADLIAVSSHMEDFLGEI